MSTNSDKPAPSGAPQDKGEGKKARKGPMALGRIILALAAIAALSYGALWRVDSLAYVSTDDAAIDGRQAKISSKMIGRVGAVKAAEGDKVKAGQALVVLEDRDLKAQETQAAASLAYARQNLEVARIGLDKARDDFDRASLLYSGQATTKENYDHARRALDAAQAQCALAQASVDTSSAQLGVIEAQLLNGTISSPIDGIVEKVALNPGDLAQPGQTILSVSNLDSVWVTANYEETKIGRIKAGAKALITVDAYRGRSFEGKVEMIRAGIVPPAFQIGEFTKTTQRVPVKIALSSVPEGTTLIPGMSAEVKVRTDAVLPAFLKRLHL
jgi:membrane fusion protein, multidrug efflux system